MVGFLKSELESAGIACFIRNQHTNTSMTSIPTALFWPILCVTDDNDLAAAQAIVGNFVAARRQAVPRSQDDWRCPKCGESVPSTFAHCWQCETQRANPAT